MKGQLDLRVLPDFRVCPDRRGQQAHRGHKECLVPLVPRALLEVLGHKARRVMWGRRAQQVAGEVVIL